MPGLHKNLGSLLQYGATLQDDPSPAKIFDMNTQQSNFSFRQILISSLPQKYGS